MKHRPTLDREKAQKVYDQAIAQRTQVYAQANQAGEALWKEEEAREEKAAQRTFYCVSGKEAEEALRRTRSVPW